MKHSTATMLERKSAIEANRVAQYGPPPTNVFKSLRESFGWSHEELAKRAGVSKQALIRLEQGTFVEPLPRVVDYYVNNHDYSELWILDDYEQFQLLMRKRHHKYFGLTLDTDPYINEHPMRQLRSRCDVNPTEVAKALCIPQATLEHFEKKYRQQQSVPKALLTALTACGYNNNQINGFINCYRIWRKQMTNKVTISEGTG